MKKNLVRAVFILITLFIILAASGFIYEKINYRNVEADYPPDGMMVQVNDKEIHVNIEGKDSDLPPVIIETGTGNWSYDLSHIQEKLSEHTQVLTYDRSGYGWSSPPNDTFSLENTISDLHNVLDAVEMDSPAIIIGHSVGGVYARHFTDKYPDEVAGLILVDLRNEYFKEAAPATYHEAFFDAQDQTMNRLLARFGVIRLVGEYTLAGMPDFISKEKYAHVQYNVPFFNVLNEEIKQISENVELLHDVQTLHDKPLTIITPEEADSQAMELGFSEQESADIDQIWLDAQTELTNLSSNSNVIYVPNSSHAVMYDQPDVIIDAVLDMANEME